MLGEARVEEVELVAQCVRCLTLETVYTYKGMLEPTGRYQQNNGKVYHDCGSVCRLFPTLTLSSQNNLLSGERQASEKGKEREEVI